MKEIIIEVPDEFGKTLKPWKANAEIKGEFIRCKDCKWHSEKGFCKHPNGGAGNIRPDDWFCGDGEPKEDQ